MDVRWGHKDDTQLNLQDLSLFLNSREGWEVMGAPSMYTWNVCPTAWRGATSPANAVAASDAMKFGPRHSFLWMCLLGTLLAASSPYILPVPLTISPLAFLASSSVTKDCPFDQISQYEQTPSLCLSRLHLDVEFLELSAPGAVCISLPWIHMISLPQEILTFSKLYAKCSVCFFVCYFGWCQSATFMSQIPITAKLN